MPIPPNQKQDSDAVTQGFTGITGVPALPRLAQHVSDKGFTEGIRNYDGAMEEWKQQLLAHLSQIFQTKT